MKLHNPVFGTLLNAVIAWMIIAQSAKMTDAERIKTNGVETILVIFLARKFRFRFEKTVIKSDLEKAVVHTLVQGQSMNNNFGNV